MLKDWIAATMPERLLTVDGVDLYLHKDFNIPPKPEAVITAGLASTIEEAQALIVKDKRYWGGIRDTKSLDDMEALFGPQFSNPPALGDTPALYAALTAANRYPDPNDANKTVDRGYQEMLDDWRKRGLIQ